MVKLVEKLYQGMTLIKGLDLYPLYNKDSSEFSGKFMEMPFTIWCWDESHITLCFWDRCREYYKEEYKMNRLELVTNICQIINLPLACSFALSDRTSIFKHIPIAYVWEWDIDPKSWCRFRSIDIKLQDRNMVGKISEIEKY